MPRRSPSRLRVEPLEARDVPSVSLLAIPDQPVPNNKPIFLPVTVTNTPSGPVTTSVTSSNPNLDAVVVTGGRSVRFDISGTDNTGAAFTGSLTLRLFADVAPLAAQRIIDLVNNDFYDGKLIHRVLDGFVIQGGSPTGDGTGGSSLPDFRDEFSAGVQFDSPGLLALANAGDDNNNSQFFITDPKTALANRPESSLNFNHTIFGLLTNGFDTFQKAITTTVVNQPNPPFEASRPSKDITITDAVVFDDANNAVIKLSPKTGFTGTSVVQVSATDGSSFPGALTFNVTATGDAVNNRPFLGPITNPATVEGVPVSFNVPVTDTEGDATTLVVRDTTFNGSPANVTVTIDQVSRKVTLTPNAGFTGTVTFKIGVRDQIDRSGGSGLEALANYDTDLYTLTVNAPSALTVNIAASATTVQTNASVTLTATFGNATSPDGTVEFLDGTTVIGQASVSGGQAVLTTSFATAGAKSLTARFTPIGLAGVLATSSPLALTVTTAPVVGLVITAEGSPPGADPRITVRNADGSVRFGLLAFEDTFLGGVNTLVGDVNGDGVPDVVVSPGAGGGPVIKAFSGDDGHPVFAHAFFEPEFRGGINMTLGDATQVGYAQLVVGAARGGAPRVVLFDIKTNTTLLDYFAHDPNSRAGATVMLADLVNAGRPQIVTGGLGTDTAMQVTVVDPKTGGNLGITSLGDPLNPPTVVVHGLRDLFGSAADPTVPPTPPMVLVNVVAVNPTNQFATLGVRTFDGLTFGPEVDIDAITFVDKAKIV